MNSINKEINKEINKKLNLDEFIHKYQKAKSINFLNSDFELYNNINNKIIIDLEWQTYDEILRHYQTQHYNNYNNNFLKNNINKENNINNIDNIKIQQFTIPLLNINYFEDPNFFEIISNINLNKKINKNSKIDAAIFISPNSIYGFYHALQTQKLAIDLSETDIYAMGGSSANILKEFFNINKIITAPKNNGSSLFEIFKNNNLNNINNYKNILIVKGDYPDFNLNNQRQTASDELIKNIQTLNPAFEMNIIKTYSSNINQNLYTQAEFIENIIENIINNLNNLNNKNNIFEDDVCKDVYIYSLIKSSQIAKLLKTNFLQEKSTNILDYFMKKIINKKHLYFFANYDKIINILLA